MPFCEIRFGGSPVISSPSSTIRPEVGRRTPVRQLKKVLLPAPFGPITARISPRATAKSTLLRAVRPPKRTVSASVRKIGSETPTRDPVTGGAASAKGSTVTCWVPSPSCDLDESEIGINRPAAQEPDKCVPAFVEDCEFNRGIPLGEFAGRREHRLFFRHRVQDTVLAVMDVEDELAQERLVVVLAQQLIALREVVAFLHFEAFQRLDQLRRVGATLELGFLHAELQRVHCLEV